MVSLNPKNILNVLDKEFADFHDETPITDDERDFAIKLKGNFK